MIQKVGNVTLNYKFYTGTDSYSDGDIEDEVLAIAESSERNQFNRIISEKKDWTILYHLSHIRGNIVRSIGITKEDKVLEIGSGCGAITGALAENAKKVTCIELSKRRSMINANQNSTCDNVEILVGNFQAIEPHLEEKYDVITLIGVFEYANLYINSKDSFDEFISRISTHLAPGGRCVIAIENKFGLKYWAGCKEDHLGSYYSGLEGYPKNGVETFSNKGLKEIFDRAGFVSQEFYYPYPDYKLPATIYSDAYLPKAGELNNNLRNFDHERLLTFNEGRVFDQILDENMFPFFSNSYLVVLSKEKNCNKDKLLFANYENDRDIKYAVKTEVFETEDGEKYIKKTSLEEESVRHINNWLTWKNKLDENEGLKPCSCEEDGIGIRLSYVEGETFEEVLDKYLEEENYDKLFEVIKQCFELCRKDAKTAFVKTEAFEKVFGDVQFKMELKSGCVNNVGLLFSNIKGIEQNWQMTDYEWCFDFPVPVDYILYRMLKTYVYGNDKRTILLEKQIFDLLGESKNCFSEFDLMEQNFQRYVQGETVSIDELYVEMGREIKKVLPAIEEIPISFAKKRVKVYIDRGDGYSDETAYWVNPEKQEDVYSVSVPIESDMIQIRIDPAENPCCVGIKEIYVTMENGDKVLVNPELYHNAEQLEDGTYLFATYDPWIIYLLDLRGVIAVETCFTFKEIGGLKRKELDVHFLKKSIKDSGAGKQETAESALRDRIAALEAEREELENKVKQQDEMLHLMQTSLSWKVTGPLRNLKGKIKGFTKR